MTKPILYGVVAVVLSGCSTLGVSEISDAAKQQAGVARQQALEFNKRNTDEPWTTGEAAGDMYGYVTPLKTYRMQNGVYCRSVKDTYVQRAVSPKDEKTATLFSNWCRSKEEGGWNLYTGNADAFATTKVDPTK